MSGMAPNVRSDAETASPTGTRSRQRVIDHGEVFTPPELVNDMLDLVGQECERIDSRILEPALEDGSFVVDMLRRELHTVTTGDPRSRSACLGQQGGKLSDWTDLRAFSRLSRTRWGPLPQCLNDSPPIPPGTRLYPSMGHTPIDLDPVTAPARNCS